MSSSQQVTLVESLDHEGRGVAHVDGKTLFISGALPYEIVHYQPYRKKSNFELADTIAVVKDSFLRTAPLCPYFGTCGGCSMQHVEFSAQVAIKQRVLEDSLKHIGGLRPDQVLPAITGPSWGYRHRARLSARLVDKKGGVLVGFHEKHSRFIADMTQCLVLPASISALVTPLRELILSLSINRRLPQVEVAVGDKVDILVFRIMENINADDYQRIKAFADKYSQPQRPLQIWLQPQGPDSCYPCYPKEAPALSYTLPEFQLEIFYAPTEFTQVNPYINARLVARAMQLLAPRAGERIADMFCGIGNFTLPLARLGCQVYGMEGSQELVARARANAVHNKLDTQITYEAANLFAIDEVAFAKLGRFNKMLIDPPRDGAIALVKALTKDTAPQRIVYVSCNPATLARDASVLVHTKGYRLKAAGVINMFPHTAHVESIAWFEKV